MRLSKTTISLATAGLILSAPFAFAQDRDTGNAPVAATKPTGSMSTGRSDSMRATTAGSMNAKVNGGVSDGTGSTKETATGGPAGGNPTKN